MILHNENTVVSSEQARKRFADFARLSKCKVFVSLTAYLDESYDQGVMVSESGWNYELQVDGNIVKAFMSKKHLMASMERIKRKHPGVFDEA